MMSDTSEIPANRVLRALDAIAQGGAKLSKEQTAAIDYARHAILRERDQFTPEAKEWNGGDFLLYRRNAHGRHPRSLTRFTGGARMPKFRHKTRESAEIEAARLLAAFPESTFIVLQEVGRVKMKPASGIEAAAAGETGTGSTEGESPAAASRDANTHSQVS